MISINSRSSSVTTFPNHSRIEPFQSDRSLRENVNAQVGSMVQSIRRMEPRLDRQEEALLASLNDNSARRAEVIHNYQQTTNKANETITKYLSDVVTIGEMGANEQEINLRTQIIEFNRVLLTNSGLIATNALSLINQSSRDGVADFASVITALFERRFQEMKLCTESIHLILDQERHDLNVWIETSTLILNREKNIFEQMQGLRQREAEERLGEHMRSLDIRVQEHNENMDTRRLELEGRQIDNNYRVETMRVASSHSLGMAEIAESKEANHNQYEIAKRQVASSHSLGVAHIREQQKANRDQHKIAEMKIASNHRLQSKLFRAQEKANDDQNKIDMKRVENERKRVENEDRGMVAKIEAEERIAKRQAEAMERVGIVQAAAQAVPQPCTIM